METGIIQSIEDDKIIILMNSMGECQSCPGNKICSTGNSGNKTIEVINTDSSFKVGDKVNIEFKPKIRVLSAIILFFIPLIILIAFYYIGFLIFKKENISILISFSGFILYFIIIFFFIKSKQSLMDFNPIITKTKE